MNNAKTEPKTIIRDDYGNEHTIPGPFGTVQDVKDANAAAGRHFFSPDTMRFFKSRVGDTLYAGRMFVTSEKGPDGRRAYTLRIAADDGECVTSEHGFQAFATARNAAREAKRMVEGA